METDIRKILTEINNLYKKNKIEDLSKIIDSKEESGLRKIAAHLVLQNSQDIRRK